jgi:UDP-N-acetylglucosamine 2-epimerase (non-hydrolysing)
MILVQGDTTTAMAGALAGFHRSIPVGHVEAGLRSGNDQSPFPEEMNRKLITRLATYHFAATESNRQNLLEEGILNSSIFVTGNPVVDALHAMRRLGKPSSEMARLLRDTEGYKRVVLTTHRRESFGAVMRENLKSVSKFVQQHADVVLIFPVHPNPDVMGIAQEEFRRQPRVFLIPPLGYEDFIGLLENSWLIVSDSGGVQEEAPTLRKPLLVIRENTERPEAVQAGIARLVGSSAARLTMMLEDAYSEGSWVTTVSKAENPFGRGDSGKRIADIIAVLCESSQQYELEVAAD